LISIQIQYVDIFNNRLVAYSYNYSYEAVSISFRAESIKKYTLTLVLIVAVAFKVLPFRVYATGPAFLPLLEAQWS